MLITSNQILNLKCKFSLISIQPIVLWLYAPVYLGTIVLTHLHTSQWANRCRLEYSVWGSIVIKMSNTDQPESRLGLDDVSGEISRIFFSKGIQSGRPSYSDGYRPPSTGYGVPKGPVLNENEFSPGRSLYRGNQLLWYEKQ